MTNFKGPFICIAPVLRRYLRAAPLAGVAFGLPLVALFPGLGLLLAAAGIAGIAWSYIRGQSIPESQAIR